MRTSGGSRRLRLSYVEHLAAMLSVRDWAIVETLSRIRLATGSQLERLYFHHITQAHNRSTARGHVLKRLVDAKALGTLERRVGTARHGSDSLDYLLGPAGQAVLNMRAAAEGASIRTRNFWEPGERLIKHMRAVTELYVTLVEQARTSEFTLEVFNVEGQAYWPDGLGGRLKPDAFVRMGNKAFVYNWWCEVELSRKSRPAIRSKLKAYLDFYIRGQRGPDGYAPRVIVGVETPRQETLIRSVAQELQPSVDRLFVVASLQQMPSIMITELLKEQKGRDNA